MADPYANMNPILVGRIQSLIAGARAAGYTITPGSGYRDIQQQIALRTENGCPDVWTSPASSCRVPTAIPGHSNHNHGLAMDLDFHGNAAAAQWANAHGADFGLHFPVHGEDWHVEMIGNDMASNQAIHDAMAAGALGSGNLHTATNPNDEMAIRLQDITKIFAGGDYSNGTLANPADALATPNLTPTDTTNVSAPGLSPNPMQTITVQDQAPESETGQKMAGTPQRWGGLDIPPPGYVPPGAGTQRWAPVAAAALRYTGQDARFLPMLLARMARESGGNNEIVNHWDSNAMRGDPTTGLMQNIPSAWQERAQELAPRGITDGFANIVAAIRYTLQRYGTLAAWQRRGGY